MEEFYVENKVTKDGAHIVHRESCSVLPAKDGLRLLGVRSNPKAPLNEAANWFGKSVACPTCMAT